MSKFPRIFAESTLNRMKKKLNLPEEKIKLLYDYFEAFSNFYQLLSLKDAYKIINSFDPSLVTKDEFIAFSEILRQPTFSVRHLRMAVDASPSSSPSTRKRTVPPYFMPSSIREISLLQSASLPS